MVHFVVRALRSHTTPPQLELQILQAQAAAGFPQDAENHVVDRQARTARNQGGASSARPLGIIRLDCSEAALLESSRLEPSVHRAVLSNADAQAGYMPVA